jgi:dihydrofolate synthase/folylpolyglutamate synthase
VAGLEDLLATRAAFGMRLGLDRMRLLLAALGEPQRSFRAIHVVGTNGKTSTTLFAAAILEAHGLVAGAYISPHVHGFRERVQVGGAPLAEDVLAAAVARVEEAAAGVDAAADEPLTQFEVLTAAAFVALASVGAEAVVVEAGLGGRYDATNVLDAPVVALTNIGLDHVEQLGGTRESIAAEKLAVLAPGADLIAGSVDAEIEGVIRSLTGHAGSVRMLRPGIGVPDAPPLAARGRFQRENLALALVACERLLGDRFDRSRAIAAAARVVVPGRLQAIGTDPLVLVDGAHNPHGARALVAELGDAIGDRTPLVGVIAILADKDVDGVLDELVPRMQAVVATQSASPRALPAADLAVRVAARGVSAEAVTPPSAALVRARERAGATGAVLVSGSLSLLEELAPLLVQATEAR